MKEKQVWKNGRRKGRGKNKGGDYERALCKKLSLWWTQDLQTPRDDVFWRAASSGGRARIRGRTGRDTANSHGDICAIDPIGMPLMDLLTIEVKRGYNRATPYDLLDKGGEAEQTWEEWIRKAEESAQQAGSFSWAIIAHRDKRKAVIATPSSIPFELGYFDNQHPGMVDMGLVVEVAGIEHKIVMCRLDDWLSVTTPRMIIDCLKRC